MQMAHGVALTSVSLALSQTPAYTARPRIRASVSRGVPVYSPAFAGTHCACPRRDGQADLTWVAGYIQRWFTCLQMVTHLSTGTNRARQRVTMLIETRCEANTLPLSQMPPLINGLAWTCPQIIGVGGQSTLGGQDIFARKYMHEKLTKCPNFTWYLPEKLTKFLNFTWYMPENINKMPKFYMIFARKIFFPNFGRQVPFLPLPPSPTPMQQMKKSQPLRFLLVSFTRKWAKNAQLWDTSHSTNRNNR